MREDGDAVREVKEVFDEFEIFLLPAFDLLSLNYLSRFVVLNYRAIEDRRIECRLDCPDQFFSSSSSSVAAFSMDSASSSMRAG